MVRLVLWLKLKLKTRRKRGQQMVDADCVRPAKLGGDAGDTGANYVAGHHAAGVRDERRPQRCGDRGVKRVLGVKILVSHFETPI